jgi:hypothetical protein
MRFDRRVRDVAVQVGCLDRQARHPSVRPLQIAALGHYAWWRRHLLNVVENRFVVGTGGREIPLSLDLAQRLDGNVAPLAEHRDHPAVLHRSHAARLLGRRSVRRFQRRPVRRRPQNGRVQHPRQQDVARVLRPAGDLVHAVLATGDVPITWNPAAFTGTSARCRSMRFPSTSCP